jgi:hypothetical protein
MATIIKPDFDAAPGLDPVTGLGVPDGMKLLAALQGTTPPVVPPPVVPPPVTPPPIVPPAGPTISQIRGVFRTAYAQRLGSIPPGWWHGIQTQIVASDAKFTDAVLARLDVTPNTPNATIDVSDML